MPPKSVKLKEGQPIRRFVGIDVTDAVDTVAFGHMWNATFGWRNLLWDLDVDPADNQKRVDKAHPKLPVKRLKRTHGGSTFADTCLMPQGIDGLQGPDLNLRDAVANNEFMHSFILSPTVDHAKSELNASGSGTVADVVFISSHGYKDGEMAGATSMLSRLFRPAASAFLGAKFNGPAWVFLSNCSTLDPSAQDDWLTLMSGPNPLRGIVGFQDKCPLADGSVDFVGVFISELAKGASIRTAWKTAVSNIVNPNNWVVLCHNSAKDDTIADINDGTVGRISAFSPILLFDNAHLAGFPLVPQPDPFEAFWSLGGVKVTPANQFDPGRVLGKGDTVTITVRPPAGTPLAAGQKIVITLVYIRFDYVQNVNVDALFEVVGQTGASPPGRANVNHKSPDGPDSWTLPVVGSPPEVVLTLRCRDLSSLHDRAQPLTLQVSIGSLKFDFHRNGKIIEV